MDLYYDNNIFASNLKELLQKHNMTGADLAKRLDCSKSIVTDWLKGRKLPRMDKIDNMCLIFNCKREDLISDKPKEESIIIMDDVKFYPIPMFNSVAAGFSAHADSQVVGYNMLPFKTKYEADESMQIKVQGDSMFPKIEDGDSVIVHKQTSVDSGTVAVVLIDGEDGVVKKVVYDKDWIELQSFNPMYPVRRFEGADVQRLRVMGKVTKVIKEM